MNLNPLLYLALLALPLTSSWARDEKEDIYINQVLEACDAKYEKSCNFVYTFAHNKGNASKPAVYLVSPAKGRLKFFTTANCEPSPGSTLTIAHYIGDSGKQAIVLIEEEEGPNWDSVKYSARWDQRHVIAVMKGGSISSNHPWNECKVGTPTSFDGGP